ncbi:MAG: hypothetical protein R2776_04615 [Flavobacteriaceae bacterium]
MKRFKKTEPISNIQESPVKEEELQEKEEEEEGKKLRSYCYQELTLQRGNRNAFCLIKHRIENT